MFCSEVKKKIFKNCFILNSVSREQGLTMRVRFKVVYFMNTLIPNLYDDDVFYREKPLQNKHNIPITEIGYDVCLHTTPVHEVLTVQVT